MISKRLRVFLVDDDIDDHEFFIEALKEISPLIKCVTVQDGDEALKFVKENETFIPDFIFLDLNMPKVSGKECLLELMKIDRIKPVPIYIYSTSSSNKEKTETLKAGARAFISKPSSIRNLVKILSEIVLGK